MRLHDGGDSAVNLGVLKGAHAAGWPEQKQKQRCEGRQAQRQRSWLRRLFPSASPSSDSAGGSQHKKSFTVKRRHSFDVSIIATASSRSRAAPRSPPHLQASTLQPCVQEHPWEAAARAQARELCTPTMSTPAHVAAAASTQPWATLPPPTLLPAIPPTLPVASPALASTAPASPPLMPTTPTIAASIERAAAEWGSMTAMANRALIPEQLPCSHGMAQPAQIAQGASQLGSFSTAGAELQAASRGPQAAGQLAGSASGSAQAMGDLAMSMQLTTSISRERPTMPDTSGGEAELEAQPSSVSHI